MTPEEIVALVQGAQTDAVRALEDDVRAAAGTQARAAVLDVAVRDVTRAWVRAAGGPRTAIEDRATLDRIAALVRARVQAALKGFGDKAARALTRFRDAAVRLGADQGIELWRAMGGRAPSALPKVRGIPALARDGAALPKGVADVQRAALALLRPAMLRERGLFAALAPVAKARGALDLVNAAVTRIVGGHVAAGQARVTEAVDAPYEVWIAERDACARCLRLSGHVVATGAAFPGGLSFDPAQRKADASPVRPPLHPHCRCKTVPYDPAHYGPGDVTLPEAARREALRSAVRGFSLPSESNASRIRAAKSAIAAARPGDLPKSVIAYGRSAVRQGKFPRGRDVPNPAAP